MRTDIVTFGRDIASCQKQPGHGAPFDRQPSFQKKMTERHCVLDSANHMVAP